VTNAPEKRDHAVASFIVPAYEDGVSGFTVLCAVRGRNVSAAKTCRGRIRSRDVIVATA